MAKINSSLSRVFSGLKKNGLGLNVIKNEMINRKKNSKLNSNPVKSQEEQELSRIIVVVQKAIEMKSVGKLVAAYEENIKLLKAEYEKNPTPELEEQIKKEEHTLQIIEEQIDVLSKAEKETEKEKRKQKLINGIKSVVDEINTNQKNIEEQISILLKNLSKGSLADIRLGINNIFGYCDNYERSVKTYEVKIKLLKELGIESTEKYNSIFMESTKVEDIYRALKKKLEELKKESETELKEKEKTEKDIISFIRVLPKFLENKKDFDLIKEKVDAEFIKKAEPSSEEKTREIKITTLKALISQKVKEHKTSILEAASLLKGLHSSFTKLEDEIDKIIKKDFSDLEKITETIYTEIIEKEIFPYELYYYLSDLEIILTEQIKLLNAAEYGTEKFKAEYSSLKVLIHKYQNNEISKKYRIEFDFNEEELVLKIKFNNPKLNDYQKQVVTDDIKSLIIADRKVKPTPTEKSKPVSDNGESTGGSETPAEEEIVPVNENKDLKQKVLEYSNKINQLNDFIKNINECNAKLISFDTLDPKNIPNIYAVINTERMAKELDEMILTLKVELSKDRNNIRKTFNCFVNSIPEIKNLKIEKIKFNDDYKAFVEHQDTLILEAEETIIRLAEQKKNASDTLSIDLEIEDLLDYIEAQNSFINRRLAEASISEGIDLVSVLSERRKNKKAKREELNKIRAELKNTNREDNPLLTEEVEKLEEILNQTYAKWLEQVEKSPFTNRGEISLDESRYSNEIESILASSTVPNKEIIAEKIKAEFEKKKAKIIASKKDASFKGRVTSVIKSALQSTVMKVRMVDSVTQTFDIVSILKEKIKTQIFSDPQYFMNITEEQREFIDAEIQKYKLIYEQIFKEEKILLSKSLMVRYRSEPKNAIESLVIDDNFENQINRIVNECNRPLFQNDITSLINHTTSVDLENNKIKIYISQIRYNFVTEEFSSVPETMTMEVPLMSSTKFNEYQEFKRKKSEQPIIEEPKNENDVEAPKFDDLAEIKVNNRKLNFASNKKIIKVRRDLATIINSADGITITLIKNGLRIKYSETLRAALKELGAKISLVNNNEGKWRSRTTQEIRDDDSEQVLSFNDKRQINPEDYRIELRIPGQNGQTSHLVGNIDLKDINFDIQEDNEPRMGK